LKLKAQLSKTLVVITGPTGIGKTGLCTQLASALKSPIISADSRQMYREMSIGTAVPSPQQLKKVKHYFIGNLSIHDYYNASMFEIEAMELLQKLFKTFGLVIMTGGSGLYIDAVCHGIDDLPAVNNELRKELAEKYKLHGIQWLREQLITLDPDHYEIVDQNNPKRMMKAIEISLITGRPYSSFLTGKRKKREFNIVKIGLNRERKELYKIINTRVDEMIGSGLQEEAGKLYPFRHLNALNTVGYKELFDYIEGKTSLDEAIALIKRNSRRYAKRQLTWLARDREINWFHPSEYNRILLFIKNKAQIQYSPE
jgi:tRNA dimethylallyltransferase